MATAAARSPSPAPARPCSAMRRSMDSALSRLASSSPSDSPKRSCASKNGGAGGHPSPRSWYAEKENEQRDAASTAKAVKVRSGAGGGGVVKSFMAPTISAASKAVAASASPRKKVLGERNELPIPSSPLQQQAKQELEALVSNPRCLRLSLDQAASASPAPASAHGSRYSYGGDEPRMENLVCTNQHQASGVLAASVDAEPSIPPYDPKTNYLSPRPQFLHYKPNPRIEEYRHGGSGMKRLEDGFSSESSEEDTPTEAEQTEEEPEQPSSVTKDLLVVEPTAPSEATAEAVVPAEPCVLPPEPVPDLPRARAKQRSSLRFMLAPLALILFIAAGCVCAPSLLSSPVMSYGAMPKALEFLSVQELHPVELAAWLKHWSSSSLELAASYWASLATVQQQEFFGSHFAANLSAAAADADHGVVLYNNIAETRPSWEETVNIGHLVQQYKENIYVDVSAGDPEVIAEPQKEMARSYDAVFEEELVDEAEMEREVVPASVKEEAAKPDYLVVEEDKLGDEMTGEQMASLSQNLESPVQSAADPQQVENVGSSESPLQQNAQTGESEGDHIDSKEGKEAYPGMKSGREMWPWYWENSSTPAAIGAALAAIVVTAVLVFLYMKKQARVVMDVDAPAEQAEIETQSGSGSSEGHLLVKGSKFQSPSLEQTEKFGDSGASQYSSSLSSGRGRTRKAKEEQSLSIEPRSRRESTAHSSSSYGSFTTYEKISTKKGIKDDEVITPVRRSSRLRGQAKSPVT